MTDQHPITPPPELVQQWVDAWLDAKVKHEELYGFIATQAARWGSDQELEACCEWLRESLATPSLVQCFLTNRRPKPPSLKEQAHEALGRFFSNAHTQGSEMTQDFEIIRRAVEALPND